MYHNHAFNQSSINHTLQTLATGYFTKVVLDGDYSSPLLLFDTGELPYGERRIASLNDPRAGYLEAFASDSKAESLVVIEAMSALVSLDTIFISLRSSPT